RKGSSASPSLPITALIAVAAASIRLITRWVVNQWVSCSPRGASEIIIFITCTSLLVVDAVPSAASLDFFIHLPGPRAHLASSGVSRCFCGHRLVLTAPAISRPHGAGRSRARCRSATASWPAAPRDRAQRTLLPRRDLRDPVRETDPRPSASTAA